MTGEVRMDALPRKFRGARRDRADIATMQSVLRGRGRDRRGSVAGSAHTVGRAGDEIRGSSGSPGHTRDATVPGYRHDRVGAHLERVGFVIASQSRPTELAGDDARPRRYARHG